VKTVQRKLIQKLTLIAKVKGYDVVPENGKVVIKRQGRVIFIVEVIEVGFSISSPIGSDDWTEEDMELFEYINSLLMEHSILRALKRALRDGK
jgi:hypothetical protein